MDADLHSTGENGRLPESYSAVNEIAAEVTRQNYPEKPSESLTAFISLSLERLRDLGTHI